MDIAKLPIEQQTRWLHQRGWESHPDKVNVFIDPDTRMSLYVTAAVQRALADCRVASDTEINPVDPTRKDDAPWPKTKTG